METENELRSIVTRSLGGLSVEGLTSSTSMAAELALGLRLRTGIGEPYVDPTVLAFADGFDIESCPRPLVGRTWGASNGRVVRYLWRPTERTRGLLVAFGLADGLFCRMGRVATPTEQWTLAAELLFPTMFRSVGSRALVERQRHAPSWLASKVAGGRSGVFLAPGALAS